ncbi:MAG: hypothetical protein ABL974_15135 [Prosthecobacter sp.]
MKQRLPEGNWNALDRKLFKDCVNCLRQLVAQPSEMAASTAEWEPLLVRLDALRDLRNHLAHGALVNSLGEDMKTWTQRLVLTKEFSFGLEETRQVSFDELRKEIFELADLTEKLTALAAGGRSPNDE